MARSDDYITTVRDANRKVWEGHNTLLALQAEWNAGAYGDNMPPGTGSNAGLTKTEVGAVVFDTANAIKAVMDAGSGTNMVKLL